MRVTMRFAVLWCLAAAPVLANKWSGDLVNAKCYADEERNVGEGDNVTYSDRDLAEEVRYCAPTTKTHTFGVVLNDWSLLRLDADGNRKAAEFVRRTGKKHVRPVTVDGTTGARHIVHVSTISSPITGSASRLAPRAH